MTAHLTKLCISHPHYRLDEEALEILERGLKVKEYELNQRNFSSTGNFGFGISEHIPSWVAPAGTISKQCAASCAHAAADEQMPPAAECVAADTPDGLPTGPPLPTGPRRETPTESSADGVDGATALAAALAAPASLVRWPAIESLVRSHAAVAAGRYAELVELAIDELQA